MAKIYTLHPIALVAGFGKSNSYLSNVWNNLFYRTDGLYAGETGDRVESYYFPGTYIYDTMRCVNFMFDATTLATLRTKNITSVKFKTKVSGKLWASGSEGLTQQLRYKYDSSDGVGTGSTSAHWSSASDVNSSGQGNAVAGRFVSPGSEAVTVSNYEIELTLPNGVPKYGFVAGPASMSYNSGLLTFSSNLSDTTLTVVTDEVEDRSVIYSANGGTGAPATQTYPVGASVTLSTVRPTRTGYNFLGWSQDSKAAAASYNPGGTYTFSGNVTLYAVWAKQTYTISFNANGGINPPSSQTKTYGVDLTLTSAQPTREGYAFLGWAKSNTANEPDYASGATYNENGNATLYAVWQVVVEDHTLSYDANGGIDAPASETKTFSVLAPTEFTVSEEQPTRAGHQFKGWSSAAGGTVEYSGGEKIPASADKTLYAVWQIDTYAVTFNANGGINQPAAQTKTYNVDLTLTSAEPTRDGYIFQGWAESSDATEIDYAPGGTFTKNQAQTLYAVWKIKTYTVQYDAAGGSAAPADQTKVHGETLVLSSYIPRLKGYRFRGWGLAPNAQTIAYAPGDDYTANANVMLYALWRRSMYAGVYVVRDGRAIPSGVYV